MSPLSHTSRLFFKAFRSVVNCSNEWSPISDEMARAARYTNIFSSIHGFLGMRKLSTSCHFWANIRRTKALVSSISWFCKVGSDVNLFSSSFAFWTPYYSAGKLPYDCISLGTRVATFTSKGGARHLLECATKTADIASRAIPLYSSSSPQLLFLNVVCQAVIRCSIALWNIYTKKQ